MSKYFDLNSESQKKTLLSHLFFLSLFLLQCQLIQLIDVRTLLF